MLVRSSEFEGVLSGFDLLRPFTGVGIGFVGLVGEPPAVVIYVLHHVLRFILCLQRLCI